MLRKTISIAIAAAATLGVTALAQGDETAVSYSLVRGTCKYPIAVPADDKPIFLVAIVSSQYGPRMKQETMVHRPSSDPNFIWSTNASSDVGADIMCLSYPSCYVYLQIGPAEKLRICNAKTSPYVEPATGTLTFIY